MTNNLFIKLIFKLTYLLNKIGHNYKMIARVERTN